MQFLGFPRRAGIRQPLFHPLDGVFFPALHKRLIIGPVYGNGKPVHFQNAKHSSADGIGHDRERRAAVGVEYVDPGLIWMFESQVCLFEADVGAAVPGQIYQVKIIMESFYPLMLNTAKRSRTTVEALELRGYRYAAVNKSVKKIKLAALKVTYNDGLFLAVSFLVVAVAVLISTLL